MNVKVINIDPAYERILGFLYPNYTISDSVAAVSKFIVHRDIKSKMEREALDFSYDDCIFISTQIFDEFYDEEVIKREVINFSRIRFKNRKTKLETTKETFIDDCIDFMYGLSDEKTESEMFELFDLFGSARFAQKFIEISQNTPVQVIVAALNTFLIKVCHSDNSVYYKRKSILFKDKIEKNFYKALDAFNDRVQDDLGLSWIKFYTDLVEC